MLKQENRLKRDRDFNRVFKQGQSVFDSVCGLRFEKNGLKNSRFAIVVGTKVSKSAVKRNKIRRQFREALRLKLDEVKTGFDVIVLVSKPAQELNYQEKEARLFKVLKKAGLLV